MSSEDDFRIRPGRIRSTRAQQARPFIAQALAAAQKAGGTVSRRGSIGSGSRSRLGRGQRAAVQANRLITSRTRGVVIKARVVRNGWRSGALPAHLGYLSREGVTRDGAKARMFGPESDQADHEGFAERCKDDRHHFRFIVSPDDAVDMTDLRGFTRDLVKQMESDLGTGLDWVAIDHWNTGHPHVHLLVRGTRDDGENLVIARDYIKEGMRDRARDLVTLELGPRSEIDIRAALVRQLDAERWTELDRQLARDSARDGVIDLAPHPDRQPDAYASFKVTRLRKLETLGLAEQLGPGQWLLTENAQAVLREMGLRGDIIKRIHRGLSERGIERGSASYVLAGESLDDPVLGRLVERGLDDELKGSAYAVVDGVDGRTHHIRLPDLDAAGDSMPGSIVELRKFDDANGRRRVALAVRSDLDIRAQAVANGATWLDRQALAREPVALGEDGFGVEVRQAMKQRAEYLIEEGFAQRQGSRVVFARRLLDKLRDRELGDVAERITHETGLPFDRAAAGDHVSGTYHRRFLLASGRFAMIDDGLSFRLVPWTPSLERHRGRHVSGKARGDGGVDWSFGRKRGLGL
ncbi:Type IV secretory pathway, VirD2 components (relaxase) [Paracoccus pantotrophus]|nr:Type IV secretory pathway, VirD2 components (relaxase) [Paracoccus pantotrophus]